MDGCYGEGYGGRDIEIDGEFFLVKVNLFFRDLHVHILNNN